MKITRRQLRKIIRESEWKTVKSYAVKDSWSGQGFGSAFGKDPKGTIFSWPDNPISDEQDEEMFLGKDFEIFNVQSSKILGIEGTPLVWVYFQAVENPPNGRMLGNLLVPNTYTTQDWVNAGASSSPELFKTYFKGKNNDGEFWRKNPAEDGYRIKRTGTVVEDKRKKGLKPADIQTNAGTKFSLADGPDTTFDVRGNLLDPKAVRKLAEALQKLSSGELTPSGKVGLDIG